MSNFNDEEIFEVVDKSGKVIGSATRAECHSNRSLIHRSVHIHIFNSGHLIFLQKRSTAKKIQPGKWDTAVGGHVDPGETPEQSARREMMEELGIKAEKLAPVAEYLWESPVETELVTVFLANHEGPFTLHPEELEDGRFWSLEEILGNREKDIFTPNFLHEFDNIIPGEFFSS